MIKQIFIASILGGACVLHLAQQDPWVQQLALSYFKHEFQEALDCAVSGKFKRLSFFPAQIELTDMYVTARDGSDWRWHADQFAIQISWQELLLYGTFDFQISIDNFKAESGMHNAQLAMWPHITLACAGPTLDIYTFLNKIDVTNASLTAEDPHHNLRFFIALDSHTQKNNHAMQSAIELLDGYVHVGERTLFKGLSGSLQLDSFACQPGIDICLGGAASLELPQLGSQKTACYNS